MKMSKNSFTEVTVFNHKTGYPEGFSCILPMKLKENIRILYEWRVSSIKGDNF
jgi:hypothetical protein